MLLVAALFLSSSGVFPVCVNTLHADSMCKQAHCRHYPKMIFFLILSRVQTTETHRNNARFQTNLTDSNQPRGSPQKAHLVPSISSLYQPPSLLRLQPSRLRADLDYSKPTTPSLPPRCPHLWYKGPSLLNTVRLGNVQMVAHMFSCR